MTRPGASLALSLADDELATVENVLLSVLAAFDNDERSTSYTVEHHSMCPSGEQCACGLLPATEELREAIQALDRARAAVARVSKEVAS